MTETKIISDKYLSNIKNKLLKYDVQCSVQEFFETFEIDRNGFTIGKSNCICGHIISKIYKASKDDKAFDIGCCCAKRFNIKLHKSCVACDKRYTTKNMKGLKLCKCCRGLQSSNWKSKVGKNGRTIYTKRVGKFTFSSGLLLNDNFWLLITKLNDFESDADKKFINNVTFTSLNDVDDYIINIFRN